MAILPFKNSTIYRYNGHIFLVYTTEDKFWIISGVNHLLTPPFCAIGLQQGSISTLNTNCNRQLFKKIVWPVIESDFKANVLRFLFYLQMYISAFSLLHCENYETSINEWMATFLTLKWFFGWTCKTARHAREYLFCFNFHDIMYFFNWIRKTYWYKFINSMNCKQCHRAFSFIKERGYILSDG